VPRSRPNIDKAWFMSRMSERGLSLRKLAKSMDMDPSALSRALSGERKVAASEARKIAELLDTPESQVLAHLDPADGRKVGRAKMVASAKEDGRRHSGFREGQTVFKGMLDMDSDNEEYVVPQQGADPLFGCMAGTLTLLPDVDYTAPADPDWAKVYDD
jgi:transcriptional regulator with XRE-family HTH domain